jgi:hypothetical protein
MMQQQGQGGRRRQIPAFGRWNQHGDDEVPITQYFESAVQAGLLVRPGGHCCHDATAAGELVLFRSSASPPPHKPAKKVLLSSRELLCYPHSSVANWQWQGHPCCVLCSFDPCFVASSNRLDGWMDRDVTHHFL